MKNKKNILKIGACLCVMMFVFISVLNTTEATTSLKAGTVETRDDGSNSPATTVYMNPTDPYNATADEDNLIIFECDYYFEDVGSTGGSNHIATISVWYIDTTPWTFIGAETTGITYLSSGVDSGTISVTDNYDPGTLPRNYSVTISVSCEDLSTSQVSSKTPPSLTVFLS